MWPSPPQSRTPYSLSITTSPHDLHRHDPLLCSLVIMPHLDVTPLHSTSLTPSSPCARRSV